MFSGSRRSVKPSKPCAIILSTLEVAPSHDSIIVLFELAQFVGGSIWSWPIIVESHSVCCCVSGCTIRFEWAAYPVEFRGSNIREIKGNVVSGRPIVPDLRGQLFWKRLWGHLLCEARKVCND